MQYSKISISRIYLFKRIIAKIIVIIISNKFIINIKKYIPYSLTHFFDVEGIFYKLKVEREIENILIINNLIKKNIVNFYVDIGANYGQFSSSIKIDSSRKVLIEPNPSLWNILFKLNPGANILKIGLIESGGGSLDFLVVPGNSGACRIANQEDLSCNPGNIIKVDIISVNEFYQMFDSQLFINSFIKIDIEGRELSVLKAFNSIFPQNVRPIYAFETLSKNNVYDVIQFLDEYIFFSARFSYQGEGNRNYHSFLTLIKVFINGNDNLMFDNLNLNNINRDFYSLIFCIPKEHEKYLANLF